MLACVFRHSIWLFGVLEGIILLSLIGSIERLAGVHVHGVFLIFHVFLFFAGYAFNVPLHVSFLVYVCFFGGKVL
jgi:hypothetical protein